MDGHVFGECVFLWFGAQHRGSPGVRDGLGDPLRGYIGVDGKFDGSAPGQRESGPDLPGTSVEDGSNHVAGGDTRPLQPSGQVAGDPLHLGVGPFLTLPTQCGQVRIAGE